MNVATLTQRKVAKLSADKAIGLTVAQHLSILGIMHSEAGAALGISQSSLSKKLNGLIGWSATELLRVANYLGVTVNDLMPSWHEKAPESEDGFEGWVPAPYVPGLSRLRESNSRPFHYE